MPQIEDLDGTSHHRQKSLLDLAVETYDNLPSETSVQEQKSLECYIQGLAAINCEIQAFRGKAAGWTTGDFVRDGKNAKSSTLGKNLEQSGKPCPVPKAQRSEAPNRIEPHHIIPVKDKRKGLPDAPVLRAKLFKAKIRMDDPDNGVWLPKGQRDCHPQHPNAIAHRRIHRFGYYKYLMQVFTGVKNPVMFRVKLDIIAKQLLEKSQLPNYVMLPKHMIKDDE